MLDSSAPLKLIVGLGNPGRQYKGTRHNVGFEVLAELARRFGGGSPRIRFEGELVEGAISGHRVLLLCPHTYMNRSGYSVQQARDFYKLQEADVLVVCDDLNLPLAKLRLRSKGSAGGQKGLEDIIRRLGTEEVPRLRIGIGFPPPGWDPKDYVLGKFIRDERDEIERCLTRAADAAASWVSEGLAKAMNQYNPD